MTLRRLLLALRILMLRTQGPPLRTLWRFVHVLVIRITARYLLAGIEGASLYMKGGFAPSGDPIYGISDIDLVVVVGGDASHQARAQIESRWERLGRIPVVSDLFDLFVYEEHELERALSAPFPVYGLAAARNDLAAKAVFWGRAPLRDDMGLQDRPGLHTPGDDWGLLLGKDRRPLTTPYDDQTRRLVAWLELQLWWRYVFPVCVDPSGPRTAYLCVKLVAESARILLWLLERELVASRRKVLERAITLIPEEAEAFRQALRLLHNLPKSPRAPVAEFLPPLVRLSSRIASRLEEEIAPAGATEVELEWRGEYELVPQRPDVPLPAGVAHGPDRRPMLRPLVDWRAIVVPPPPDETFALLEGDPTDVGTLARGALTTQAGGPYPAFRAPALIVTPAAHPAPRSVRLPRGARWKRVKLRGIQCSVTDPVSFALLEGRRQARFPNVAGWSIVDVARRAVAEHRAWLALRPGEVPSVRGWMDPQPDPSAATVATLGRLMTAARAALLDESVSRGAPRLPLSVAAVARELAERRPRLRTTIEEAYDAYRAGRDENASPSAETARAFAAVVRSLSAYDGV